MLSLKNPIPNEIRPLVFVKTFSTFSFAVLFSSLTLYMTRGLGFSHLHATGIVGVFVSLNFLLHFFGAYFGGKIISNRVLLSFGILMELIGLLVIHYSTILGIAVFVTGSGLYATSIKAIMLQRYEPDDNRREAAAFWIYSAMNLGFFLGNSVSGYFHNQNNYQLLFSISALFSISCLLLIAKNWKGLADMSTNLSSIEGNARKNRFFMWLLLLPVFTSLIILALNYHSQAGALIMFVGVCIFVLALYVSGKQANSEEKGRVLAYIILVLSSLAFWSIYFIGPMGLVIFIQSQIQNNVFGFSIAPQWYKGFEAQRKENSR